MKKTPKPMTTTETPEREPELLAFVHVTPGPYPSVENFCGHTFEQHEWDYEGVGSCNGDRSKLYDFESVDDEPFRCGCIRSPDQIEIEWLRTLVFPAPTISAPTF